LRANDQFYESQGFRVIDRADGAANEAKMPDVLMEWDELHPADRAGNVI
jgi:hypothetical protein